MSSLDRGRVLGPEPLYLLNDLLQLLILGFNAVDERLVVPRRVAKKKRRKHGDLG